MDEKFKEPESKQMKMELDWPGRCKYCYRKLRSLRSIALGYGPECKKKAEKDGVHKSK